MKYLALLRLTVRRAHPSPLTEIRSQHSKGVRRSLLDEKLIFLKASFRLFGIKHQINCNPLYYISYLHSNFLKKLLGCLVKR